MHLEQFDWIQSFIDKPHALIKLMSERETKIELNFILCSNDFFFLLLFIEMDRRGQ